MVLVVVRKRKKKPGHRVGLPHLRRLSFNP
jgi:hypothetical protein